MRNRVRYAQNFIRERSLAARLVGKSDIGSSDLVVEIGPGDGILTFELARRAGEVIAYEIDPRLAESLVGRSKALGNVRIVEGEFLEQCLPSRPFKCLSNIPFNSTADIVRRLKDAPALTCAWLIVQREAANKYCGDPIETESSACAKPWFSFRRVHDFRRSDFEPAPGVDVAMFEMRRRDKPLLPLADRGAYSAFVRFGFRSTRRNLKAGYKRIFTHTQWKRLAKNLDFAIDVVPHQLHVEQWVGLFSYFVVGVSDEKKRACNLAEAR